MRRKGWASNVLSAVGLAATLAACTPVVAPVPGGPEPERFGPEIVIDVWNRSDRDVLVGYEFSARHTGGGGEGGVSACTRSTLPFGDVAGSWEILVDGERVVDGEVPAGAPARGALVAQVSIEADGTVTLDAEPAWRPMSPPPAHHSIPCG